MVMENAAGAEAVAMVTAEEVDLDSAAAKGAFTRSFLIAHAKIDLYYLSCQLAHLI